MAQRLPKLSVSIGLIKGEAEGNCRHAAARVRWDMRLRPTSAASA